MVSQGDVPLEDFSDEVQADVLYLLRCEVARAKSAQEAHA